VTVVAHADFHILAQIPDLVRDAGRERTEGRELLLDDQLLLRADDLGVHLLEFDIPLLQLGGLCAYFLGAFVDHRLEHLGAPALL
jgi:hypothetical protein